MAVGFNDVGLEVGFVVGGATFNDVSSMVGLNVGVDVVGVLVGILL